MRLMLKPIFVSSLLATGMLSTSCVLLKRDGSKSDKEGPDACAVDPASCEPGPGPGIGPGPGPGIDPDPDPVTPPTDDKPLFIIGDTVPDSKLTKVNIGSRDDINSSGIVGDAIDEIKPLIGTDRVIGWENLTQLKDMKTISAAKMDDEVILQAFNMTYRYIEEQIDELDEAGYTMIQISPPQKALEKYGIWWESYQPVDHRDFSSRYGDEDDLRSLLSAAHSKGIKVIADTVLNHMADPLRYNPASPLYYNGLYEPKHFINYDLYLDLTDYKMEVLRSPVDEYAFYYSTDRSLYRRYSDFLAINGIEMEKASSSDESRKLYETLFVYDQLPWMFDDLERQMDEKGVALTVDGERLICESRSEELPCLEVSEFHQTFENLFGAGALIVRGYYFELGANLPPIYQNEWDDLEKVLIKWYPGLPSLNTSDPYVLKTHADLVEKMLRLGIDGFRLDAVKHIPDTYFSEIIEIVRDRLKVDNPEIDGETILKKPLYVYGEMATSEVSIANQYRDRMDVTDFFLLDTYMYSSVFPESFDLYGRGSENLQNLRKSALIAELEASDNTGWQKMLYPIGDNIGKSYFSLESFDRDVYLNELKSPIYFARIHDSVVGDMFILRNYQQAMLGHAYFLAATEGRALVYGSDEDVYLNAGADYKEKIVLAAMKYRRETSGLTYKDDLDNVDYCGETCDRTDLLFIDREDKGLALIYSGRNPLAIEALTTSLAAGCYLELMSGRKVEANESGLISRLGKTELTILPRTAAFFLPTDCAEDERALPLTIPEDVDLDLPLDEDYDIFLRGSFNGWAASDDFILVPSQNDCFASVQMLDAGEYSFKIGDENWSKVDIGGLENRALSLGENSVTNRFTGDIAQPVNLSLVLSEDTELKFEICGVDTETPVLTVSIM